jgi:hypothetical protein
MHEKGSPLPEDQVLLFSFERFYKSYFLQLLFYPDSSNRLLWTKSIGKIEE